MRHETSRERCVVGAGGAALAEGTEAREEGWAALDRLEPASADRDSVHSPDGAPVAAPPPRDGMR